MFNVKYFDIIKIENLLVIWKKFLRGKRHKKDVMLFQIELADNLSSLYYSLINYTYTHGSYSTFNISDPKPRNIHKASVRDRLLHHLIYEELYPYFDRKFIFDLYSCRKNKGLHRALNRFRHFARKVSKNNSRTCYILKCDIQKFFANINHQILIKILERHISDFRILWLVKKIIFSFYLNYQGTGLPLGNLTSQFFANIYMNEFDRYIKQELQVKYYIRYGDDFVIISDNKKHLNHLLFKIRRFLKNELKLALHENKIFIKTHASGLDFLGWIHFPYHRQIRTTTKRKVIKRLKSYPRRQTIISYRGLLSYGNTYKLREQTGLVN